MHSSNERRGYWKRGRYKFKSIGEVVDTHLNDFMIPYAAEADTDLQHQIIPSVVRK